MEIINIKIVNKTSSKVSLTGIKDIVISDLGNTKIIMCLEAHNSNKNKEVILVPKDGIVSYNFGNKEINGKINRNYDSAYFRTDSELEVTDPVSFTLSLHSHYS